jgi:hypothetical protein
VSIPGSSDHKPPRGEQATPLLHAAAAHDDEAGGGGGSPPGHLGADEAQEVMGAPLVLHGLSLGGG